MPEQSQWNVNYNGEGEIDEMVAFTNLSRWMPTATYELASACISFQVLM
jgi:hypothetical protein